MGSQISNLRSTGILMNAIATQESNSVERCLSGTYFRKFHETLRSSFFSERFEPKCADPLGGYRTSFEKEIRIWVEPKLCEADERVMAPPPNLEAATRPSNGRVPRGNSLPELLSIEKPIAGAEDAAYGLSCATMYKPGRKLKTISQRVGRSKISAIVEMTLTKKDPTEVASKSFPSAKAAQEKGKETCAIWQEARRVASEVIPWPWERQRRSQRERNPPQDEGHETQESARPRDEHNPTVSDDAPATDANIEESNSREPVTEVTTTPDSGSSATLDGETPRPATVANIEESNSREPETEVTTPPSSGSSATLDEETPDQPKTNTKRSTRLPVSKPLDQELPFKWKEMIAMVILQAADHRLLLKDIYQRLSDSFPFYQISDNHTPGVYNWANTVRHQLSVGEAFYQMSKPTGETGNAAYWTVEYGWTLCLDFADNAKSELCKTPRGAYPPNALVLRSDIEEQNRLPRAIKPVSPFRGKKRKRTQAEA